MLEELERVRAHRAHVSEPDRATTEAAFAALAMAIHEEARDGSAPRRRWAHRRRRLVLAGGLACGSLAIAGAFGLRPDATSPPSALAAQMNQLAQVAAGQAWTGIPGPGQYLYTESYGLSGIDTMGNGQECQVSVVQHRQIWIATDGSGAIAESDTNAQFTSPADQAACAQMHVTDAGSEDNSWSSSFPAGGLSFPTNDWRSLSTDPATLLKQIHQLDGGPNVPAEWFTNLADFLRESDTPPAIRAALYRAAALIPGVKLLGAQTDPRGGSGLGLGYYDAAGDLTAELIINQQSARLQAEEYFGAGGKLSSWYVYEPSKIVGSHPDFPMTQATTVAPVPLGQATTSTPKPAGQATTSTPKPAGQATTSTPTRASASKAPGVS